MALRPVMAGRITCLPNLDNYIWRGGGLGLDHRDLESPGDPDPENILQQWPLQSSTQCVQAEVS